jgi:hypothetical protein
MGSSYFNIRIGIRWSRNPKLNELNDSYEVENLVENLKQTKDYKSMHVFTD